MWMFTRTGFISVTKDPREAHNFLVRARTKPDLERLVAELGEDITITETPERDYRWRMSVHRADFIKVMVDQLMELDYSNVKDAIDQGDPKRHRAMLGVWSAMMALQEGGAYNR